MGVAPVANGRGLGLAIPGEDKGVRKCAVASVAREPRAEDDCGGD